MIDNIASRTMPSSSGLHEVDCVIVGGGAAGLSAAVNLGRMRRRVLLLDERDRMIWQHTIENYIGFPDGLPASEIRRLGWRHAARFGVELMLGHAAEAAPEAGRFRVRIQHLPESGMPGRPTPSVPRDAEMARLFGTVPADKPLDVLARTVLIATGVLGHFPEFPGRDQCVGESLFWCIHCDGYESIDRVVGVVGHDEEAVETALDLLDFTNQVTIVAGRPEGFDVPPARLADLAASGIAALPFGVKEYRNENGKMQALLLDDPAGTIVPAEHLYTVRASVASNQLARQLGVTLTATGQVVVNTNQETNVPGVYAAGDVTDPHDHQISAAVHEGNQAACAANYYMYRPEQRFGGAAGEGS